MSLNIFYSSKENKTVFSEILGSVKKGPPCDSFVQRWLKKHDAKNLEHLRDVSDKLALTLPLSSHNKYYRHQFRAVESDFTSSNGRKLF